MAFPQVIRLAISAFPARLAYGMIGLGIFFKTEQETGSIAAAGFAIGLNSLAGALTAGIRGSALIITLPGKPTAIAECLGAVIAAVPDCLSVIGAPSIELIPAIGTYRPH